MRFLDYEVHIVLPSLLIRPHTITARDIRNVLLLYLKDWKQKINPDVGPKPIPKDDNP